MALRLRQQRDDLCQMADAIRRSVRGLQAAQDARAGISSPARR